VSLTAFFGVTTVVLKSEGWILATVFDISSFMLDFASVFLGGRAMIEVREVGNFAASHLAEEIRGMFGAARRGTY
jgi:hypothetical protein